MKKLLFLGALIAVLPGCGGSNNDGSTITELRVMNLVTDSNLVGFELNEVDYAVVAYQQVTAFASISGTQVTDLELLDADGITSTLVSDKSITMDGNREYTFYAVGTVASADFFAVPAANDDPSEDSAKMQFVNATLEPLTVFVYEPGLLGSGSLFTDTIGPRDFIPPIEVPSQSVQLQVQREDGSVAFVSLRFTLQNEWDITFVLTDYLGPGQATAGVEVLRVEDTGNVVSVATNGLPASMRYVDALTGLADLSVMTTDLQQSSSVQTVSFADGTPRELIEGGLYNVQVTPADNIGAPIFGTTLSLIGGFDYSVVLTGELGSPESILLVDETRPIATHAQIAFVHAAQALPEVDIYISEFGADIFSGTTFREVPYRTSRETSISGEVHNITITSPGSTSILVGPFAIDLSNGSVETLLLHESVLGGTPFSISKL